MKWNKVTFDTPLPTDGRTLLALWKGRICFAQFETLGFDKIGERFMDGWFFITYDIVDSEIFKVSQDRMNKFTHWMDLPELPEDY